MRDKAWKLHIFSLLIVMLLIAAVIYATRENDPLYSGKRLSRHLESLSVNGLRSGGVTKHPDEPMILNIPEAQVRCSDIIAHEAVLIVGSNALPRLVRMLQSKESRIDRFLQEFGANRPWIQKLSALKPRPTGWKPQTQALAAIKQLGPEASFAIPQIVPMLKDPDLARLAIIALLSIRPEREADILSLTNVLGIDANAKTGATPTLLHSDALLALSSFGSKAAGATPFLLACLESTNGRIQSSAAIALARIAAPAHEVVPVIISHLPKPDQIPATSLLGPRQDPWIEMTRPHGSGNLLMNLWALGEFGTKASNALPALSNLVSAQQGTISDAARETIAKIRAPKASALP